MQEDKSFKILIAGLDGVGKRTIISKFNEGYLEFKNKIKAGERLTDGEDRLVDLEIELEGHTISSRAIDDDEYIAKKSNDLNKYKIIVIVFDLGKKDSIKEIASTIQGSSLNFSKLNATSKCALWGNKNDQFHFSREVDERTAQKVYELEQDLMMVSYVKANSISTACNEPFQNVSILIQDYLRQQKNINNSSAFLDYSLYSRQTTNDQDSQEIDKRFLQRGNPNKKSKSSIRDDCQITSFKCSMEKTIPIRPNNSKKPKKLSDDMASSRSGAKNCSIF